MILRLCVERYVSERKQPLFLYIRHIRNNLHMFSASGESFYAVVRTGAGICFPADGCTGGYCRTDICLHRFPPKSGGCRQCSCRFVSATASVVSFYANGRNSCRYAALQNRRSHENPPPPPGGREIMCLKYCMIEWCAMSKSSFCENITGRLFLRLLPTNPAPASSQQRGVTRFSLLCNKS